MFRLNSRSRLLAVVLSAIGALLSVTMPVSAQNTGLNFTGASNCRAADFDASVQFLNGPDNYYTIEVDKRNISNRPCIFDGPLYGPSPNGGADVKLCYNCFDHSPNEKFPNPPVKADPGEIVQQLFRWRTSPQTEAARCIQLHWMAGPVLLSTPSLLKQICSDVEVSRFRIVSRADTDDQNQPLIFNLTSDKAQYYENEGFSARVSLAQAHSEEDSKQTCPTLYLRERRPDGETRIDEVHPIAFKGCGGSIIGQQPSDRDSGFDLYSRTSARWTGVGEHSLQVFQLAGSPNESRLRFASSNVLRVNVADASLISRKWGERINGVAVDIALDKDTFRLGEDVPLHIALENSSADVPVYGADPVWDPCFIVGIEVRGTGGIPLDFNHRFPNYTVCTGDHGRGLQPYAQGKVVPLERTLGLEGWLPNYSGTFNVVVTWDPCLGPSPSDIGPGILLNPPHCSESAVVHAAAIIHIVDGSSTNAK